MQSVPAVLYDTIYYEGEEAYVRNLGNLVKEIFIPSFKVIINSAGEVLYSEKPRNEQLDVCQKAKEVKPLKEISISNELVKKIVALARLKLEVLAKEEEAISDLKTIWG